MSGLLMSWALLAAGFSLVAWWRVRRTKPSVVLPHWPKVLLLRPVDAPSPAELSALASPIDYGGVLEQVVLAPYRPRLNDQSQWLYSDPTTRNRKVGHLLYALSVLPTEGRIVLAVDADVPVTGELVRSLVAPLVEGAALSYAAPSPAMSSHPASWAVRGLLGHSHHSFMALNEMSAGAKAVCGKALGLSSLAQGELQHLSEVIGEDLELASRLARQGERVELASTSAPSVGATSWRAALARFTRWMQVLRAHRPSLYPTIPLFFACTPVLLLLALGMGEPGLWGAVALLILSRSLLSVRLGHRLGGQGRAALWLWMLGELLLGAAFLASLFNRTVVWRGRAFSLERNGTMRMAKEVGP